MIRFHRLLTVSLVLLLLLGPSTPLFAQVEQGATMTVLRGEVAVIKPDGRAIQPAPSGTVVMPGDEIRTLTPGGALITFFTGIEIELGQGTILVVTAVSRQGDRVDVSLRQVFGATVSRVQTFTDPSSSYRIEAGGAVAVIRGSTLAMRSGENTPNGVFSAAACSECGTQSYLEDLGSRERAPLGPGVRGYYWEVDPRRGDKIGSFEEFKVDPAQGVENAAAEGITTGAQNEQGAGAGSRPAGQREQRNAGQAGNPGEKSPDELGANGGPGPGNGAQVPVPTTGFTTIASLNPSNNPPGGNCATSFVSTPGGGAFGGTPQFVHFNTSLAQFAGRTIRVRFFFDTRDSQFNAHEGWYVDNIRIGQLSENVESDVSAWTFQNQQSAPRWHVTNRRAAGGSRSFVYQDPSSNTYRVPGSANPCFDARNAGGLVSPPVAISSGDRLEFDYLFQIESVNPATFDVMLIQVVTQ